MKPLVKVFLIFISCIAGPAVAGDNTVIAVAANMARTIVVIQKLFHEQTGLEVKVSLGSSGALTNQILYGAPFSVFLSADPEYIQQLVHKGVASGPGVHYATGRICFFIPENSRFTGIKNLGPLISHLSHGDFSHLAIANPRHAPYGRAAETALQRAGIWALDSHKLVIAENIAQTLQFTDNGSVDLGIIAWSHYLAKPSGECLLIPEYWHDPIEQYMILLDKNNKTARTFFNFMQSEAVRKLLTDHGYIVP